MIKKFLYKIRKILYVIGTLIVLAGVLGLSYVIYMRFWCNFHIVTLDKFYRSGQMGENELTYYLKKYKIKSLVNLEGANPNDLWYQNEIKVCKELGVAHYNIQLSTSKIVEVNQTKEIIDLLVRIDKPILVHCNGGADRSGFVSAIWEYAVQGKTADKSAADELTWRYFHLPYLGNPSKAMDKSFWMYVDFSELSN